MGVVRGEPLALTDREGESVLEALRFLQLPSLGVYNFDDGNLYTGVF